MTTPRPGPPPRTTRTPTTGSPVTGTPSEPPPGWWAAAVPRVRSTRPRTPSRRPPMPPTRVRTTAACPDRSHLARPRDQRRHGGGGRRGHRLAVRSRGRDRPGEGPDVGVQAGRTGGVRPGQPDPARPLARTVGERAAEGRVPVAEPDRREEVPDDGPPQRRIDLVARVAVPVDVPADARAPEQVDVVLPREQAHVVDLRDPRREELEEAGEQVAPVVPAQRVVEGAVDLVQVEIARG